MLLNYRKILMLVEPGNGMIWIDEARRDKVAPKLTACNP
jgi:hypothetical protein